MFIPTIYNRRAVSLSNMDGKINAIPFTPLFILLIHYDTFLISGVYALTMVHLAITVVLKNKYLVHKIVLSLFMRSKISNLRVFHV